VKYGIKIPFILDHDYLWVTEGDAKFQIRPLLFDEKEEAEEFALKVYGQNAIVAEYGENENPI
jgi:hypothetical protein